jgi:hypothetical protein
MPNWNRLQSELPSPVPPKLLDYAQRHESTRSRMSFAEYHLHNLDALYASTELQDASDAADRALAEVHSVIFSLDSALDSLAYELNLVYQLGVPASSTHIFHEHGRFMPNCVRCHLDSMSDPVTSYLETELGMAWFGVFIKLRSQIATTNLPIIKVDLRTSETSGGAVPKTLLTLPNDPSNANPRSTDYSMNLEANQYCQEIIDRVRHVIEGVYPLIEPKVRKIYASDGRREP